jgi:hypothetical protein
MNPVCEHSSRDNRPIQVDPYDVLLNTMHNVFIMIHKNANNTIKNMLGYFDGGSYDD